ncbi:MAG TPA: DUF87 domain-containing protein [Candidatus Dormibacteraeota bacterium]|nr:DUF87 domain-containing protein [Candidatus Dormibacteraeota bacterium]
MLRPQRDEGALPLGSYEVRDAVLRHPDGSLSALLLTQPLDVRALDEARRRQVVDAFGRLFRALEGSLQLLVRVRRVTGSLVVANSAVSERESAMRVHWQRRLEQRAAFVRTVVIAVRAQQREVVEAQVEQLSAALRGAVGDTKRLAGSALAAQIGDGLRVGSGVPWKEYAHHLEIGHLLVRGYAMRRLPGHVVSAGWLAPLLCVETECDIAVHVHAASLHHALTSLGRRLRDFSARRLLEAERGAVSDAHVDAALESTLTLRERLAHNLGRPLRLSITACARARDLDVLRDSGTALRTAFAAALIQIEPGHFRHAGAFVSTLPLGVDATHAARLVDSAAANTCLPWVDAGGADPAGYRIGRTMPGGVPVRLDPFDTSRHTNANVAVLAASGHGKSFAISALVIEAADQGIDVIVVDPEGEYSHIIEVLGGSTLELAPGSEAALNIFDGFDSDLDATVSGAVELVAVMCGVALSEVERAHVDAAARAACAVAIDEQRRPLLVDCVAPLSLLSPDVAAVLRRYCTGALGQLFNRHTTTAIARGVSSISLRELPDEQVAAATFVLTRWLWDLVRSHPRRRHIVFDEVGALCMHAPLRRLLLQLARRCRKHAASLVVATQNAQDLLGSEEGRVVATNCATVLLGGHAAAETGVMQAAFGLTDVQRRFLGTAGRGEFLLLAGDRRTEMRVEVPDLHRGMIEAPRRR